MDREDIISANKGRPDLALKCQRHQPYQQRVMPGAFAANCLTAWLGCSRIEQCGPDVQARYGQTPIAPKIPFVPGYAILGDVDAVGDGVTRAAVGDRVSALTVFGGYAEYIYLAEDQLIPTPTSLDPAEAVTLILNYVVAYQTLHRSVKVQAGDKVLMIGASGGVGTALLQLGKLADLIMYGIASPSKHGILTEYGATPIDYHSQDFVEVIRAEGGADVILDMVGGDYLPRNVKALADDGRLVQIAFLQGPKVELNFAPVMMRRLTITGSTLRPQSDLAKARIAEALRTHVWPLLEAGKIAPVMDSEFALADAAKAHARMETSGHIGKIVLKVG